MFLLSVKSRRLSRKSGGVGGESGQLFASGCGEGLRRPRRPLAPALRALSEFSFFCLHRVLFRLQSIDCEWFVCEGVAVQTRVKILCNGLVHSVLRVKARGCAFRLAAFTLRAVVSPGNLLRRFCRVTHCSKGASR